MMKQERMVRAAEGVLRIIHQKGVQGLSHTQLARSSGLSRAWLYKYVGKDKNALLVFAIDYFGQMFIDLLPPEADVSRERWHRSLVTGFDRLLGHATEFPGVIRLYYQYRGRPDPMGRRLEHIESLHSEAEVSELIRVFGTPRPEARVLSETLVALRLGLAHSWVFGGLDRLSSRDAVVARFGELSGRMLGIPGETPHDDRRPRTGGPLADSVALRGDRCSRAGGPGVGSDVFCDRCSRAGGPGVGSDVFCDRCSRAGGPGVGSDVFQ